VRRRKNKKSKNKKEEESKRKNQKEGTVKQNQNEPEQGLVKHKQKDQCLGQFCSEQHPFSPRLRSQHKPTPLLVLRRIDDNMNMQTELGE
jgi:hypothetical protein